MTLYAEAIDLVSLSVMYINDSYPSGQRVNGKPFSKKRSSLGNLTRWGIGGNFIEDVSKMVRKRFSVWINSQSFATEGVKIGDNVIVFPPALKR